MDISPSSKSKHKNLTPSALMSIMRGAILAKCSRARLEWKSQPLTRSVHTKYPRTRFSKLSLALGYIFPGNRQNSIERFSGRKVRWSRWEGLHTGVISVLHRDPIISISFQTEPVIEPRNRSASRHNTRRILTRVEYHESVL
jgi:hypothetical protein